MEIERKGNEGRSLAAASITSEDERQQGIACNKGSAAVNLRLAANMAAKATALLAITNAGSKLSAVYTVSLRKLRLVPLPVPVFRA